MVAVAVVCLLVAGSPVAELRARARPAFSIAPMVALGLNLGDLSGYVPTKLAFGLAVEGGLVIRDRSVLTLQLMGSFLPPTNIFPQGAGGFVMTGGGPSLDWLLTDRWSVGAGTHVHAYFGGLNSVSLMLPLRVNWRFAAREPDAVARQSFVIGFQLAAGFSLIGLNHPSYSFNLTVSGLLTIGHGWW